MELTREELVKRLSRDPASLERVSLATVAYFVSTAHAIGHYRDYVPGYSFAQLLTWVEQKLSNAEIHLGPPPLQPNQTARPDSLGQYMVTTWRLKSPTT